MKEKIILVGAGGHARACIDVIEGEGRFEIAGVVERSGVAADGWVFDYPIIGTDDDLAELRRRVPLALVTVGQIKSPDVRMRLFERLVAFGFELPSIVSPLAHVSRHSSLGKGTIVMHHALVSAGAVVGANCIINTRGLVEHDAVIEDHCHIATGAIVNGGAVIQEGVFVGSNAVIREGVVVARRCVIGAGAIVLNNPEESARK